MTGVHADDTAEGAVAPSADPDLLVDLYARFRLIRRVEEEVVRLYPTDEIKSPVHLSIGQEAVAVAVCQHLAPEDVLVSTYRGHATYLAKGGDLQGMWAELYGRSGGVARGKAGSMHLVDPSVGVVGTSAIVASGLPVAVGYALTAKLRREDHIVVAFFGEGATDEGVSHEAINFAALHRLPILLLCENNSYAIYSHVDDRMAGDLQRRLASYDIPGQRVRSGDILDMHAAAGDAIARVRAGEGPQLLEIDTMRWHDHVGPGTDLHHGYRSEEALEAAKADDQLPRMAAMLDDAGLSDRRAAIDAQVEADIAGAIAFAASSPPPGPEELHTHVFAD